MKSKAEIIKEINRLCELDFSDEHDYYTRINALKWVLDGDYSSDENIDNINYKHLLALAVARFRAGEEYNKTLKLVGQKKNEREIYLKWQQAISAYEAAVKGEGE